MNIKRIVSAAVAAVLLAVCGSVMAESNTGGGTKSAVARLDFEVKIPGVIQFRVGTDSSTIDLIKFQPTATDLIDGETAVAATTDSGDLGNGKVTVEVFSNRGQVTITEANDGGGNGLDDGAGGTISYDRIDTTTSDSNIPAPVLSDGGGNTAEVTLTNGNFTDVSASWTYTFDASNLQADPGSYTGRVTYTAAAL